MKKIIFILFCCFVFINFTAYASLENDKILNDKVDKIKKIIYKKGDLFKTKIIYKLNKYKTQFIGNEEKQNIINYILPKIEKMEFLYGKTISNAPILNTGSFINTFYGNGYGPILDEYGQIDPIESVLFSGTTVIIKDFIMDGNNKIYKIQSNEYDFDGDLFIDARFIKTYNTIPSERTIILPTKEEIINNLISLNGYSYIWGGNILGGIPELAKYYKPKIKIGDDLKNKLILNGFDCSGLLFFATNGYTPRNTSKLVYFGTGVEIEGLNVDDIIKKIEPLDLIVWKGHVMIILDKENLIESRINYDTEFSGSNSGVKIRKIKPVLENLMLSKIGLNNYDTELPEGKKKFVIRRWIK